MPTSAEGTVAGSPTALVRAAAQALHEQFFEPLAVANLYRDAWEGATAALARAGVAPLPPAPAYPADPVAAHALHEATFPALERLAARRLGPVEITVAALDELLRRRRDGHTFLFTPRMLQRARSMSGPPSRTFGLILSNTSPLTVADVLPRGPAQRAGLRRGQTVLTINGEPAAHLRRLEALALMDQQEGAANTLTVRAAGGETAAVELPSDPLPPISTAILPGPFGLLRIDGFTMSVEETDGLRAALASFQQAGALGWIIDMRWNGGGVSIQLSRLLVDRGRLFSRQRHAEARLPDGTVLVMREDIEADGTALPFQRPLVVLIGPGSTSGAESFAGPLQAFGRATLVGERTAGWCGAARRVELAPDWVILLAAWQTVFGPEERRANRVGVTPDVVVTPSPQDEAAGRDPQLEAALDILRSETAR